MAAAEPIRDKKELKKLAEYYLKRGQLRNYVLIVMGAYTALRISDLLRLTWNDVYNFEQASFRTHITITEKKTGKTKTVALNGQAIYALRMYFSHRTDDGIIFSNNRKKVAAISRIQAYRIIRIAAEALGLAGHISCHSLRKTFGYHAWNSGVPIVILMDIYNHSSYEITRRYLGVSQDDMDKVYLEMKLI